MFEPVSGRGFVRSWTVVRQSFLPGFEDDLPFVLVDVELEEQPDLRMIGRLPTGPRWACGSATPSWSRSKSWRPGSPFPRSCWPVIGERDVPGGQPGGGRRLRAERDRRHAPQSLGALTFDTARRAIADAGLTVDQIDGFTTGALFPASGAHAVEDGVTTVTSNWLAQHLGVNPR